MVFSLNFFLIISAILASKFIWHTTVKDEYFFSSEKKHEKRFAFVLTFFEIVLLILVFLGVLKTQSISIDPKLYETISFYIVGIFLLLGCINYRVLLWRLNLLVRLDWKILQVDIRAIVNGLGYGTLLILISSIAFKGSSTASLFQFAWVLFGGLLFTMLIFMYIPFLLGAQLGGRALAIQSIERFFRKYWFVYLPLVFVLLWLFESHLGGFNFYTLFFSVLSAFSFLFCLSVIYGVVVYGREMIANKRKYKEY